MSLERRRRADVVTSAGSLVRWSEYAMNRSKGGWGPPDTLAGGNRGQANREVICEVWGSGARERQEEGGKEREKGVRDSPGPY